MVKGLEIRDAHFPGRAPLDAYGDGGFRFAEMSHRGSLLCVPSGIYGWNLTTPAEFRLEAFERVFEEQPDIEVLLVGTGPDLSPLSADLKGAFREAGILADPMSTGAAVRTYNVLLSEGRAVAAALLAVD
ncbi:Mth938-like domain-containing protein [Roseibium alexandrii]|uniref:Mth938-like domain-containing protein n=1 Tax=Roseibium alexandrii TaxID=388408 RepID=UPI00375314D6